MQNTMELERFEEICYGKQGKNSTILYDWF